MTEIADDRSWWADVEHLRPGGEGPRTVPPTHARAAAVAVAERSDRSDRPERELPDRDDRRAWAGHSSAADPRREEQADAVPRGRITGASVERAVRPRRPDVAAFADALDLDGAFGAPVSVPRSREIILTGAPSGERDVVLEYLEPHGSREPVQTQRDAGREPSSGRRTVQISGTSGLHAPAAERRALREIGERRPRSAVERVVHRPDRIAMYVVLLGLFLVFIAATGSSAGS
jgi:hypothetical protein